MKRHGNLWPGLIAFPNLLRAALAAQRGKRFRPCVARFHFDFERELWALHEELARHTYRPGPYRTFRIHESKERLISAAPYRDRVVHQALCNVLEPIFERSFLPDSYACRTSKGTHAAVRRCRHHARRFRLITPAVPMEPLSAGPIATGSTIPLVPPPPGFITSPAAGVPGAACT
jgi:hypothetical protein